MATETGSSSQPKRYSQFNKIILPHNLEDETLEIPQEIVREHGDPWFKYVILEVSAYNLSKSVRLKESEGHYWLGKGWKDIVMSCSIKVGYSLVFQFEGGCLFNVHIFDASGLGISHPVSSAAAMKNEEEDTHGDSSVEILHDWPHNADAAAQESASNQSIGNDLQGDDEVLQGEGISASDARDRVLPRDSFSVVYNANRHSLCFVQVPARHASVYLLDQDGKEVILHGAAQRTWSVTVKVYRNHGTQVVRLSAGWRNFTVDNHLKKGDTCVFELLSEAPNHYNVAILRTAQTATPN